MKAFYRKYAWYKSFIRYRDEIYEDIAADPSKQIVQWGVAVVFFFFGGLLFGLLGVSILKNGNQNIISAIILFWTAFGFVVSDICLLIVYRLIDLNSDKGHYYFNHLFWIAVFSDLPFVIIFSYISSSLDKNDIDLATFFLPFKIIPVDCLVMFGALGMLPQYAGKIDSYIEEHHISLEGYDMNAIVLLFIIVFALLIMHIVNCLFYLASEKSKEKKKKLRSNEILERETEKEKTIVTHSVKESNNQKRRMDLEFQHGWKYIKTIIARFQLILLIYLFVGVALAPGKAGIINDEVKSSYINAITLVTLFMLYIDKHNSWKELVHQSSVDKENKIANSKEDVSDCVH